MGHTTEKGVDTMCTAVQFFSGNHYFGRNLDLEYCYQEAVTITPRNFPFSFRCVPALTQHYAIIGMATIVDNYPLYYDGTNEAGLSVAALNFPGNAIYGKSKPGMQNIAPFELIPWVLSQCKTRQDAVSLLQNTNLAAIPFSPEYPLSDLHWMVADKSGSIVAEPGAHGLMIYENPAGVLTNNPPFEYHLHNLCNYMTLSKNAPENTLIPHLDLKPYSRGMGAMGLPGDLSSASRFIRAVFTKSHSATPSEEHAAVNQFFHILGSVIQQEGCVQIGDSFEKTVYSSCCNTDSGTYYYTTYENRQITAVHLHNEDLSGNTLTSYPLLRSPQIRTEN